MNENNRVTVATIATPIHIHTYISFFLYIYIYFRSSRIIRNIVDIIDEIRYDAATVATFWAKNRGFSIFEFRVSNLFSGLASVGFFGLTLAALALPAGAQTVMDPWAGTKPPVVYYPMLIPHPVVCSPDMGCTMDPLPATGDADLDAASAACLRHRTTLSGPPYPVITYAPGFEACPAIQARADAITAQRQAEAGRARKVEQDAADAGDRALVGKVAK